MYWQSARVSTQIAGPEGCFNESDLGKESCGQRWRIKVIEH